MKNAAKGFTLTELMITLGVFAILLAVAVPTLKDWLPRYRLKAAARQIASDMQLARYRAIATNVRHGVYFDATKITYKVYSDDNGNANFDSGEEEKTVTLENVTCTTAPQTINFLPTGTATADTVTIENTKGQASSIVVLGTTGRIRIE